MFTNPTEVLELVKGGVPLKSINIGGMRFEDGKTQISKSISITSQDAKAFQELNELGVELDLRVLKTDSKQDILKLIADKFQA